MKRLLAICLIFFTASQVVKAQDPSFTQLFNNRVYLNPAFAGVDPGVRVSMVHRNLWRAVAKKNFYTSGLVVDYQNCRFPTMGLGMMVTSDVEGDGVYKITNAALIYSYKLLLGRRSSLSMAMQGDYYNATLDWTQFTFSDQFDPVLGVVRPSANMNATIENVNYFDFSSAMIFRNSWKLPSREVFWHLGAAFHHLPFGFNNAFFGNASLPMRVTVHGAWLVPMFKTGHRVNYHIMPFFRFMGQDFAVGKHRAIDAGMMVVNKHLQAAFTYKANPVSLYTRNTDALAFSLGFSSDFAPGVSYRATYSYDFNYKGASNGALGTHEISLIIAVKNTCKSSRSGLAKKDCFDYGKKGLESIF